MNTSNPLFLGIDVGTSAVKVVIVDMDGSVVSSASAPYPTTYVQQSWVEQDPHDWWRATLSASAAALTSLNSSQRAAVAAIGVSSQGPTLLALDGANEPVRPAMIWMDRRAEAEAEELRETFGGAAIQRVTGNRPDPFYVAAKLRWLSNHEPQTIAATKTFVQANGWVVLQLTGALSMDPQHAALLGLRDLECNSWWPEMVGTVGVGIDQFPQIASPTDVVGAIKGDVARRIGIPAGIPVVAGTVDGAAAALEVGLSVPGEVAEMTGTSSVVVMTSLRLQPSDAFISMSSTDSGGWLSLAAMVATGGSLDWLRRTLDPTRGFGPMTTAALQTRPGSNGLMFLPYMMGERSPIWDSHARGCFIGLTLGTTPDEMGRAVLEGTTLALRQNLERARSEGFDIVALRSTGGGSKNDLLNQLKADICGIPVHQMKGGSGAAYGVALIAAAGSGYLESATTAAASFASIERTFFPRLDSAEVYQSMSDNFADLYNNLSGSFKTMAHSQRRN